MPGRNGLAVVPAERKPLRVVAETVTREFDTGEETLSLVGYVKGAGCPISVAIEADEAIAQWEAEAPTPEETGTPATEGREAVPGTLKPRAWMAKHNRADRMLRRDLLCAVFPGLTFDYASVLAADDGPWLELLVDLGWWAKPEAADETEDDADPEAIAPADDTLTGADALPDSSPATPEPIPSA